MDGLRGIEVGQSGTMTVRLHPHSSRWQDAAARHRADELTPSEAFLAGTYPRLVYTLNATS
jgi:hypothetical protein